MNMIAARNRQLKVKIEHSYLVLEVQSPDQPEKPTQYPRSAKKNDQEQPNLYSHHHLRQKWDPTVRLIFFETINMHLYFVDLKKCLQHLSSGVGTAIIRLQYVVERCAVALLDETHETRVEELLTTFHTIFRCPKSIKRLSMLPLQSQTSTCILYRISR